MSAAELLSLLSNDTRLATLTDDVAKIRRMLVDVGWLKRDRAGSRYEPFRTGQGVISNSASTAAVAAGVARSTRSCIGTCTAAVSSPADDGGSRKYA
jgi:hypothetical protein